MNIVVTEYYGLTGGLQKASESGHGPVVDTSVPVTLRKLWVMGNGNLADMPDLLRRPELSKEASVLGGVEEALEMLHSEADAMRVWDEAEALGRDLALARLEANPQRLPSAGRG